MRKQWLGICIAASLLAACTSDDGQQQATVAPPQPAVCNGPIVEISGADPVYEPLNASANQDYERDGKSYKIVQDPSRFSQAGFAAIYDAEPGSNLTASGEAFDPMQLTAAHPTLPIPSFARVTNVKNGKSVIVRINDRGPFHKGRLIDLSYAAAHELGYVKRGSTDVVVERVWPNDGVKPAIDVAKAGKGIMPVAATGNDLALPASAVPAKGSWLQLGAYGSPSNAEAMRQRLAEQMAGSGSSARLEVVNHDGLYKLRLGPFVTPARAREVADQVYFMDGGVMVEGGEAKAFFDNPQHPRTKAFLSNMLK